MVSCLNSAWTEAGARHPTPSTWPCRASLLPPPHSTLGPLPRRVGVVWLLWLPRPPHRCPSTTTRTWRPQITSRSTGSLWHLPARVSLLWWPWCGFGELCQLFSSPVSWGEGTCWEADEDAEPARWPNLWCILKPEQDDSESGLKARHVCSTQKRARISHYWNCTNFLLWKMTPARVTTWMSRWNTSENWVTT